MRSIPRGDYPIGVSHRSLAIVCGLTLGDYLLWNWSLGGGHDLLAVISGVSLLPLLLASAWLLAVSIARVLTRSTRRQMALARRTRPRPLTVEPLVTPLRSEGPLADADADGAHVTAATASSGKLAA
jgi:hypothetical protein